MRKREYRCPLFYSKRFVAVAAALMNGIARLRFRFWESSLPNVDASSLQVLCISCKFLDSWLQVLCKFLAKVLAFISVDMYLEMSRSCTEFDTCTNMPVYNCRKSCDVLCFNFGSTCLATGARRGLGRYFKSETSKLAALADVASFNFWEFVGERSKIYTEQKKTLLVDGLRIDIQVDASFGVQKVWLVILCIR